MLCLGCSVGYSEAAGDRIGEIKSCCPFCRCPSTNNKREIKKRSEIRVEIGDVAGIYSMACKYKMGTCGVKEDRKKALELFFRGSELGSSGAYSHLGEAYLFGDIVKKDMDKARYCYELSASMGDVNSRHMIGYFDGWLQGDMKRAVKHFMLGAMAGSLTCLREVQQGFNLGLVTKEESEKALQAFHMSYDSMRSDQRDEVMLNCACATAMKEPRAIERGYDKLNFDIDRSDDAFMKRIGSVPEQACAYCYKGGEGLKKCGACKMTQYCSAECQKVHRPTHKYDCMKRAAEIFDEQLFEEPPKQTCPLCLLRLPTADMYANPTSYQLCCGLTLCMGCVVGGGPLCPSCFTPACATQEELVDLLKERMKCDDGEAFYDLGASYFNGLKGLPQDLDIAIDLMTRGAELGCADSQHMLGDTYDTGNGVAKDPKKAECFYQQAAMQGHLQARRELGRLEHGRGNMERAKRHWKISAKAGHKLSMEELRVRMEKGRCIFTGKPCFCKKEYDEILHIHEAARNEMRSDARERAQQVLARLGY